MRYELTDFQWAATPSFLQTSHAAFPRVDDRRVLNGISFGLTLRRCLARSAEDLRSPNQRATVASFFGVRLA